MGAHCTVHTAIQDFDLTGNQTDDDDDGGDDDDGEDYGDDGGDDADDDGGDEDDDDSGDDVDDDDIEWQVWGGVESCVTSSHWLSEQ